MFPVGTRFGGYLCLVRMSVIARLSQVPCGARIASKEMTLGRLIRDDKTFRHIVCIIFHALVLSFPVCSHITQNYGYSPTPLARVCTLGVESLGR
jgi:hypothetical protein